MIMMMMLRSDGKLGQTGSPVGRLIMVPIQAQSNREGGGFEEGGGSGSISISVHPPYFLSRFGSREPV